jgi:hypothetical protein
MPPEVIGCTLVTNARIHAQRGTQSVGMFEAALSSISSIEGRGILQYALLPTCSHVYEE